MGVDNKLFVRLSMTWFEIVGTSSWTNTLFFRCCELELGFDVKKTAYYEDSSPWLDLRLSELLHEQNLFFVSVELELGFWWKQTAHYEDSSVSVLNCHPNHSTPKSRYFWCVVKRSRTWALTATVRSSIHDLIWDCRNCFHEQNSFSFLLNWRLGFAWTVIPTITNSDIMRMALTSFVYPWLWDCQWLTIVHPSHLFLMCC